MKTKANNFAKFALALFFVLGLALFTLGVAKANGTVENGATCTSYEECKSGFCDANNEAGATCSPCTINSNCSGGLICNAAKICDYCNSNSQCDSGLVCDIDGSGTCKIPSGGNAIATLCEQFSAKKQGCIDLITGIGAPMTCTVAQGKLIEFASQNYTDAALVSKFVSDAVPLTGCVVGGGGCTKDTDCSSGQTCQSGTCVTSGGGGGCGGEANLENVNGLCMPKSDLGGIAAVKNWQDLAKKIIDILLTVSGVIAVLFILYGGFLYMTSGGNEEQAEKGRKALINAIIGLVVVILSFVIVQVLANLITS